MAWTGETDSIGLAILQRNEAGQGIENLRKGVYACSC
jgi:hypothetical protein